MCTEHHAAGECEPQHVVDGAVRPTRRRFLAGAGVLAGTLSASVFGAGRAGAQESASQDPGADGQLDENGSGGDASAWEASGDGSLLLPSYLNRPAWGADEKKRLDVLGAAAYPVSFYPVQKITVHHTASWTPWNADDSVELVQAVYREHVAHDFGDIGYHLLIDPMGTVFEGRYSGGTSFPIYDVYPGSVADGPFAVNAAHMYNYNAGNIGVALLGDYQSHDITDEAWWALQMTIAMICANTGIDPEGESLYRNPINGIEHALPNVLAHRTAAGTFCPGDAIVDRFDELRSSAAALVPQLSAATWLA